MKVKLEEDLCGAQEDKERQKGRLLGKLRMQPRVALRGADLSEGCHSPELQKTEWQLQHPYFKMEEQLPSCIKEKGDFTELLATCVNVKIGDEEGHYDDKKEADPPSFSQQMTTTEIDGELGGGSLADGWLAPMSDDDDTHSLPTDDEDWEGEMPRHTDGKCWKCSQCGKNFGLKSVLKLHMVTHSRAKPFVCSVCGFRFSLKGALRRHAKTHTGEKPFVCSVCGQRFAESGTLNIHNRTHTGEKPFPCTVCGKRFSAKGTYIRHSRIHTGEKPYACSVCGRRFSQKQHLNTHSRTHTGEKPYACSVCGQTFSRSVSLANHSRTHTGEKPFPCTICGQRFSHEENLTTHTRNHVCGKPFSCSVCGKRFSRSGAQRHKCTGENNSD